MVEGDAKTVVCAQVISLSYFHALDEISGQSELVRNLYVATCIVVLERDLNSLFLRWAANDRFYHTVSLI